jgi:hypothetical protein
MSGDVVRWRRKPQPPSAREDQVAVQWAPPQPLDALLYVARMADADAMLAVATFHEGTAEATGVLVVRHRRWHDDHPARIEYLAIEPGWWLACDPGEGSLYASHDTNWAQWYERIG